MNCNLKWALAIVALATSAPALAGWGYKVITDPLTDVKRGISTLSGNSGLVVIKCDDNGPGSLYFSVISDTYLEPSSSYRMKEMKYRFDGGAVETIDAKYSDQSAMVFDVQPGTPGANLLASFATSSKAVFQVTRYDDEAITLIFKTKGAAQALNKSATDCRDTNWVPPQQPRP